METQKLNITTILTVSLVTVIMTALVVFGQLTASQRIPNTGSVRASVGIGVYSDQGCTNPLTSINWGELNPGQDYQRTIYLKNLGNVRVKLNMMPENWYPSSAGSYLSLSWNRENAFLDAGASIDATLTLRVLSNAQGGTFSFDISITATEYQ